MTWIPSSPGKTSPGSGKSAGWQTPLRLVYVHMIAEYAQHNGHADLLREVLDGTTGR